MLELLACRAPSRATHERNNNETDSVKTRQHEVEGVHCIRKAWSVHGASKDAAESSYVKARPAATPKPVCRTSTAG